MFTQGDQIFTEFSQIGQLLSLGSFLKITGEIKILGLGTFFNGKQLCTIFDKNRYFGRFFHKLIWQ
jgi:hypothetical protein